MNAILTPDSREPRKQQENGTRNMAEENDFEEELNAEVTRRLGMMEEPGYEFPERMKKIDFIVAGIIMAVCLVVVEYATLTAGVM